ncbi:hypothetical protein BC943DRAFT_327596 [Umbelopsis sp. AD052]|nr:hypothetical protein BC943DRAFT_327596 [Umbelopsis sp. AD052]
MIATRTNNTTLTCRWRLQFNIILCLRCCKVKYYAMTACGPLCARTTRCQHCIIHSCVQSSDQSA